MRQCWLWRSRWWWCSSYPCRWWAEVVFDGRSRRSTFAVNFIDVHVVIGWHKSPSWLEILVQVCELINWLVPCQCFFLFLCLVQPIEGGVTCKVVAFSLHRSLARALHASCVRVQHDFLCHFLRSYPNVSSSFDAWTWLALHKRVDEDVAKLNIMMST